MGAVSLVAVGSLVQYVRPHHHHPLLERLRLTLPPHPVADEEGEAGEDEDADEYHAHGDVDDGVGVAARGWGHHRQVLAQI